MPCFLFSSGLVVAVTLGVVVLASNEASGFAGYYGESDLVYLYSFHSLVVGKVAVLLVAVVKVDSTRDAVVKVGTILEDVTFK